MTGIERLRILETGSKNTALLKVLDYLETRTDLYDRFLNEDKTPSQMWEYIQKKAKAISVNNCAVVDDKIVYVWAVSYFLASNEALGLTKQEEKKTDTNSKKVETPKKENKENKVIDISKAKEENQLTMFQEV